MREDLHPILVVSRRLLWSRRMPNVLVLALTTGAAYVLWRWTAQTPGPTLSALTVGGLAIALGIFGGIFLMLFANSMGVFTEGVAPPWKSPRHLFREPYVIPWRDITSLQLDPPADATNPPEKWVAALSIRSGLKFVFTSVDASDWFSSTSQARTFYGLLRLVDLAQGRLDESDLSVRAVLARTWPETPKPPRSQVSKAGVGVGGAMLLLLSVVLEFGPSEWSHNVGFFWALAGIVFLVSLLNPRLLAKTPPRRE